MRENCAECGAILPSGRTCQEIFNEFTMLKYLNESYLQVHFLLVSCFMIQHGRYSPEALIQVQQMLQGFLESSMTIRQLRQAADQRMNSDVHKFKMRRTKDDPPLPKIAWNMTIIDVAQNSLEGQDINLYCTQVKQWAQSTLEQMTSLHQ